ncbi:intermediate filament protein B [Ananas comosus]|uniref:Intermediate filament protein B n=1 Tax=Ananas comosus TaxID=4615 RepID=A0A6P5FXA5_ANACO|nr:intermediate filament protein B [Ananas comosus]
MALPSTFEERLQQMEVTLSQRLSLLQIEKDLQVAKSQLLATKLSSLRRMEQRRLLLERRRAELGFRILAARSEIDALEARYHAAAREIRAVKGEIEEVELRGKERDRWYEMKRLDMEEFKEMRTRFVAESREEVERLRNLVAELKSTLKDLQSKDGCSANAEIEAAEAKKSHPLAEKEKLDQKLASAYRFRTLLQKQIQQMFCSQNKEGEINARMAIDGAEGDC